jgi:uncharacterized protein (DUF2267 family)
MHTDEFFDRVSAIGALAKREDVERATRAALLTLGERIDEPDARALASSLAPPLATVLLAPHPKAQSYGIAELFRRVARREHVRLGLAREHAEAVFEVLGSCASPDALARLRRGLPPEIFALFGHVDRTQHTPEAAYADRRHHDLASGRPGSAHPICESNGDRAHRHSVARNADPHGDTKLSGARGLTQESLHETLAEGQPRLRPLNRG